MAIAEQEITRTLSLALSLDQWKKLEEAAFTSDQSLEDFAVSESLRAADNVLHPSSPAVLSPGSDPLERIIGIFKDEPLMDALMERIHEERRLEMEAVALEAEASE